MKLYPTYQRRRLRPNLREGDVSYAHVVSRIVNRGMILGDVEKVQLLSIIRRYEAFGRVRVVGYCLMDNHFHILVQVTGRPGIRPAEAVLLEHLDATLGETVAAQYRWRLDLLREGKLAAEANRAAAAKTAAEAKVGEATEAAGEVALNFFEAEYDKVLQDIWQRMYSLPAFVQSVKQQFTNWYNKRTGHKGTLWEGRYRCTLVQGGAAVAEIAAYIDLNPVRAGIVDDPKDYRWSQYGASVGGAEEQARASLKIIVQHYASLTPAEQDDWNRTQARYRVLMYRRGKEKMDARGQLEGVFSPEEVEKVWAEGGRISGLSYATTRVRYFTDGLAIGTKSYLEELFSANRTTFGAKRKPEPGRCEVPMPPQIGGTFVAYATCEKGPLDL